MCVTLILSQDQTETHRMKLILCFLRYRRSFDSEFTAPLVAYHVWPTLVEGDTVILKGEAVTKRGALVCQGHLENQT